MSIYGNWFNENISVNTFPYNHVVINNFLNENYYNSLISSLPNNVDNNFWYYCNPIEVKYVLDKKDKISQEVNNLIDNLSSDNFVNKLKSIFDMNDISADDTLHGSGIHYHPRNGRLNMHLDYEKHPILENKQRRLNIIFYLNDEWKEEWNGATELWDANMTKCIYKCYPEKNKAIIFETSEMSWHGVPEIIKCPEGMYRKTLALYYISPLKSNPTKNKLGADEDGFRKKAVFVKRPFDKYDERMEKLYKIRPFRRITSEDMTEIWPEWSINT